MAKLELCKNIDWSDYYDFDLKLVSDFNAKDRMYDLYINKYEEPQYGDGFYYASEEYNLTEDAWIEQQLLRYKIMYNIRNVIK